MRRRLEIVVGRRGIVSYGIFLFVFDVRVRVRVGGGGRVEASEGSGAAVEEDSEVFERDCWGRDQPFTLDVGDPVEVSPVQRYRHHFFTTQQLSLSLSLSETEIRDFVQA